MQTYIESHIRHRPINFGSSETNNNVSEKNIEDETIPIAAPVPHTFEKAIAALRQNIADHVHVHERRRGKRVLQDVVSGDEIVSDNEDYHIALPSLEDERCVELESKRDKALLTDEDCVNLDAVLADYREGTLKCPPEGEAVVYYAGVRRTEGSVVLDEYPLLRMVGEWADAMDGQGEVWVEKGLEYSTGLSSFTSFPPFDPMESRVV